MPINMVNTKNVVEKFARNVQSIWHVRKTDGKTDR